jgi:restriction system protein
MTEMYMSRSPQGSLAKPWKERGIIAIGYGGVGDLSGCTTRADVAAQYARSNPQAGRSAASDIAQLAKFRFDLKEGVDVITYDPQDRLYLVGTVSGPYTYLPGGDADGLPHTRRVAWNRSVARDSLSQDTRNTLGSLLTIFRISDEAAADIRGVQAAEPHTDAGGSLSSAEAESIPAGGPSIKVVQEQARVAVTDLLHALDWSQMQDLVAGVLRAMGYKSRVSPPGADRGRDVIASRDGLGLEPPRIVAQVKHRKGQATAADMRSFIGALDATDRGLFVSTGGFSRDARYEADRSKPPIALLDLDELATVLVEHYDAADVETRELVPLVAVYWPA